MSVGRKNFIPFAISLLSRSICLFRSIDQSLRQKIYALSYLTVREIVAFTILVFQNSISNRSRYILVRGFSNEFSLLLLDSILFTMVLNTTRVSLLPRKCIYIRNQRLIESLVQSATEST